MARKPPKPPSIKRKAAFKKPKQEIIVITEGKNTEPEYIKAFAKDNKNPLVECRIIPEKGVPLTIVEEAIVENKRLKNRAKKSGNSFDERYQIWCVFDRDEHPRIKEAMQKARDNSLKFILSNPCIELWGYLHYEQNDAPTHRHKMQRKLTKVMPGYDHNKKAIFNYGHMKQGYDAAVTRAKELAKRRADEDNSYGDPSTNMYELTEAIKNRDD